VKIGSSPVYLDTSALAKLYFPEPGSAELEAALVDRRDLIISDLGITELTSAAVRQMRQGTLSAAQAHRIYQRVWRDVAWGEFRNAELTSAAHREAERLLMNTRLELRAADALHLGLSTLIGARVLVTFDQRMRAAARALGTLELPDLA
jgi:predicted nucleic acid-binding protein